VPTHFNSIQENFANNVSLYPVVTDSRKAILDQHIKDTLDIMVRLDVNSLAFMECVNEQKILGNNLIEIIQDNAVGDQNKLVMESAILQLKDLTYITHELAEGLAMHILLVKMWGNTERAKRLEAELIATIRERYNEICIQLALI
jgi:hypothetical protein